MALLSRIAERVLDLSPALTRDVTVRRGLRVPMPDGVELLADLYAPRRVPNAPTILIRTPYGRGGMLGPGLCRPFAERGYQVLVQACRGTGGSGGRFDPFGHERADGMATVDWIEKQPWFHGRLLGFGLSYLGYALWAMAPEAGDRLTAMTAMITASQFRDQTYLGDSYTLRGALNWSAMMAAQEDGPRPRLLRDLRSRRRLAAAMAHLPLAEADTRAVGRPVEWFQQWLVADAPGHPYWEGGRDHRARVGEVAAPVTMVGGWYDLFLCSQLDDYAALRAAGRRPHLTIGPWTHSDRAALGTAVEESLTWFRAHVTGDRRALREHPVRLYVQGAEEWREYPDWPPPGTEPRTWYLQPSGGLDVRPPGSCAPSRFRYDPADPTPGVGGPLLDGRAAGRRDNRALEARPDVLVFTSAPLDRPVEVVGPVTARVALRSSRPFADVFVRVCEVDGRGRSLNVCDGLQRVTPLRFPADPEGVRTVEVRLWPTAYRFAAGTRIRVQVAGGSFPRFARNPGTGEPLGTATRLLPVEHEVLHGPRHRSGVTFPEVRTLS
ncbi:MAG TPA: CocE/NonD family hydrolase [Thermomonospora sp.]|nr:CocE/NonD family hydrolase [Thermomonospora sp.]